MTQRTQAKNNAKRKNRILPGLRSAKGGWFLRRQSGAQVQTAPFLRGVQCAFALNDEFREQAPLSQSPFMNSGAAPAFASFIYTPEVRGIMAFLDRLLGKPLATQEEDEQKIGVFAGIPMLGLAALSSSAYGPEAALTLLLPLGAAGLAYIGPIIFIILLLTVVYFSYRQTIAAYPSGGGSYTVAKENLGERAGLLAAAALLLDYVLNVAVGISAGGGALVSALPKLQPHTLALCLLILTFITLINLRGAKESGLAFALPTYAFVGTLGIVLAIGMARVFLTHGHPVAIAAPAPLPTVAGTATLWLLLRAFASGCTTMTGVEAVSNGVSAFAKPAVRGAQRTLTAIVAILGVLLAGIAYLCRAYGIGATDPDKSGYQSVISQLVGAVVGRGVFYYVTIASVLAVLALSANTSFADFPRLCRLIAQDNFLPHAFANRGRRLVYTLDVASLTTASALLLVAFGGITDRLIPLFAIGAFLAFTLSQAGMVVHWKRIGGAKVRIFMTLASPYRRLFTPLFTYINQLRDEYPDRMIAVIIPELVETRWYQYLLRNQRATALKAALLLRGGNQVIVINVPWYLGDAPPKAAPEKDSGKREAPET